MKITDNTQKANTGCDFILHIDEPRKIKLLQITDMQLIDSMQKRTPERLGKEATDAWLPENFDALCGNHIRSLVAQTNPDLIFITGDIIYGSFDDNGTSFEWFCNFMDSLEIPWAPTFGNHDNESKKGVDWQCRQFEKSKWCVFKRGNVTGNSNFTVGISSAGELRAVLHLLDTNACIYERGLYPDQLEMVKANTLKIQENFGRKVPAFLGLHIPTTEFVDAEISKGYKTDTRELYTIGVDADKKDNDFGCKKQGLKLPIKAENFLEIIKGSNVKAVFAGHFHCINTVIEYEGIRWVFGLKTGQYDNHIPGQVGGTLLTIDGDDFDVCHIPSLVPYGKYPKNAPMFDDFFCE